MEAFLFDVHIKQAIYPNLALCRWERLMVENTYHTNYPASFAPEVHDEHVIVEDMKFVV